MPQEPKIPKTEATNETSAFNAKPSRGAYRGVLGRRCLQRDGSARGAPPGVGGGEGGLSLRRAWGLGTVSSQNYGAFLGKNRDRKRDHIESYRIYKVNLFWGEGFFGD